ncbi:MAG: laminin G domain-containing protein, partial [Kiritimatiellae bacterium]|nr:laminin G domain-containing protein [Kiritimatiellia bacterium]
MKIKNIYAGIFTRCTIIVGAFLFLFTTVVNADITNVWDFSAKTNYYMPDEDVNIEVNEADKRAQLVLLAEENHFARMSDYTLPSVQSSFLKYGPPAIITLSKSGVNYNSYGTFTSRIYSNAPVANRWRYMLARASHDYMPDTSLVALYRMDDDGWLDVVSGLHGVAYGGVSFTGDAMLGSHSGSFRGGTHQDYVRTQGSSLLNGKSSFSIACWVKIRTYRSYAGLIASRGASTLQGIVQAPVATPGVMLYVTTFSGITAIQTYVARNKWTFIVGTFNTSADGRLRLYIDGALAKTGGSLSSTINQNDSFKIGVDDYNTTTRTSDGLIDEVAIWDRALSSNDVAALYVNYATMYPVRMQVRSGDSVATIVTNQFVGPDGTTNSFYPSGSQELIDCDDFGVSNLFAQYSTHLYSSEDGTKTPYLASVGFLGTEDIGYDDSLYDFERGDFALNTEVSNLSDPWPYVGLAKNINGGYQTSGIFESRVMQAVSGPDSTWNEITWTFAGEGLDNDLSGMIGMYHCENSWADSCAIGGVQSGNAIALTYTNAAKIGTQSAVFDGLNAMVDNFGIASLQSVEFWINNDNADDAVMSLTGLSFVSISNHMIIVSGFANAYPEVYINGSSASPRLKGDWNHVAIVWNGTVDSSGLMVGRVGSNYMDGQMDELAIYAGALSPGEILDHFVRGRAEVAGDIRFQARASNDPTFVGIEFVGVGGTSNSYHNTPGSLAAGPGEYF